MLDKIHSKLSKSEKILLAEDLWDNIAKAGLTVYAEEKVYVKERLTSLSTRKYKTKDWASIKRQIGL